MIRSAGQIGDPLYELNFIPMGSTQVPVWDAGWWAYTRTFDLSPSVAAADSDVLLVLDGVKMAADVWLNGQYIAFTNDQFLRYTFPVRSLLRATGNELVVNFTTSLDPRNVEARFMGCSGGWDWAAYVSGLCGESYRFAECIYGAPTWIASN